MLKTLNGKSDSYESMKKNIWLHAKAKGIRIMRSRLIRNKHHDIVGCQITVPLSHSQKALEDRNWPDEVTCRKWTENRHNQPSNTVAASLTSQGARSSRDSRLLEWIFTIRSQY